MISRFLNQKLHYCLLSTFVLLLQYCARLQNCMKVILMFFSLIIFRSSHQEVFLRKGVLKICSKFRGEHSCRSASWIKLQSNFIELIPRHGCSPVNVLHIFKTPFLRNTFGWLLPYFLLSMYQLIHSEHKERTSSPDSDWTSIYLTYT